MSPLMDYSETAIMTRRAISTLRKDVMNRNIPFLKIGNRVFFDRDEISAWIDSKRVPVQNQGGESV